MATDSSAQQYIIEGDSLLKESNYQEARNVYEKAIKIFEFNKKWNDYYALKLKQILTFKEEGLGRIALDSLNLLFPIALEKLDSNNEVLARLFHKRGLLLYESDQDSLAIINYRRALEIRTQKVPKNWDRILTGYTNIGLSYFYLNQIDSAQFYLEKAYNQLAIHPISDSNLELVIYQQLAQVYEQYEDLDKVIQFTEYIIKKYDNQNNSTKLNYKNQAIAYDSYAKTLRKLYRFEEAINAFKQAKNTLAFYSKKNSQILANITYNLGYCYLKMNQPEAAEKELLKALAIYKSFNKTYKIEDTHLNLSICYNRKKEFPKAVSTLSALIFESDNPADKKFLSQIFDNLGDSYQGLNQPKEAIKNYNKSIALIVKNHQTGDHFNPPIVKNITIDKKGILTTLFSKAKVLTHLYESNKDLKTLKAAFAHYQTADTLIANIRKDFLAEGSKMSLLAETKPIYEKAIGVSYRLLQETGELTYKNAILNFIENSKAIVLLEAVRGAKASQFAGIDNSLEKKLNLEIKQVKEKIYSNPDHSLELQEQLLELELQKEKFIKNLEKNHPNYYNYKFQERPPSIAELRQLLGGSTTLIEYFVGDFSSYVLTITQKEGVSVHPLSISKSDLAVFIPRFNQAIYQPFTEQPKRNRLSLIQADSIYAKLGYQLYEVLIAPLNIAEGQRLIIIPDETLNLLPFDALLNQAVPTTEYGYYGNPQSYAYLLYQHPISYCYSVSLLNQMHLPTNFNNKAQLLAFNTPEFATQITALKENFGRFNQFIHALDNASTRDNFQTLAPQYQFIHFSTHGMMNNQQPEQSHLVLNAPKATEQPLYLSTLYTTPLQAEMVVTSACDAGIGKVSSGEGILSLARGFSYAGVRSIITSLWKIKDGATSTIISQFYQNLQKDWQKDKALQLAKIDFLKGNGDDFARPYYWAGFIPIGNMEVVAIPYVFPIWMKVSLGMLILLIAIFFFKKADYNF